MISHYMSKLRGPLMDRAVARLLKSAPEDDSSLYVPRSAAEPSLTDGLLRRPTTVWLTPLPIVIWLALKPLEGCKVGHPG